MDNSPQKLPYFTIRSLYFDLFQFFDVGPMKVESVGVLTKNLEELIVEALQTNDLDALEKLLAAYHSNKKEYYLFEKS